MMTASQQTPLMEQAFQAGATDFLRKPLDEAELAGRITTAMLLVDAMKREKAGRAMLKSVLVSDSPYTGLDISERICFPDVAGMMEYHKLEEYLIGLQKGLYQINVLRVTIPEFQKASRECDSTEILQFLRATSQGISDAVPAHALLMSYVGRGCFICCVLGRVAGAAQILDSCVQDSVGSWLSILGLDQGKDFGHLVEQINDRQIISRDDAVALVRCEFRKVSSLTSGGLPPVTDIEENIFVEADWLLCDAFERH